MAKSIFNMRKELKETAEHVSELQAAYDEKLNQASAGDATLEDAQSAQKVLEDAQKLYDMQKARFDAVEKVEDEKLINQKSKKATATNEAVEKVANLFKQAYLGSTVSFSQINEAAQVSTAGAGANDGAASGDNWLPINVSNELISEPEDQSPLRGNAEYSSIVNLVLPRIDVDFGDAFDAVRDGAAANEADVEGSQITFLRHKSKVRIGFTDTLLAGSAANLVQFANNKLQVGAARYEASRAFALTPKAGEEDMSIYNAANAVKRIGGSDLLDAVMNAIADLPDAFGDAAKVYMNKKDYVALIKELSNNSATLYGRPLSDIIGVPVVQSSFIPQGLPIVGDMGQYHINYDPAGSILEQYKDYPTGNTFVQATMWYDARIKLVSGLRIVDLNAASTTTL